MLLIADTQLFLSTFICIEILFKTITVPGPNIAAIQWSRPIESMFVCLLLIWYFTRICALVNAQMKWS